MFEIRPVKIILFFVFAVGFSQGRSNTTTQETLQPGLTDATTPESYVSSPGTRPATSPPSPNLVSNSKTKLVIAGFYSGRNGIWDGSGMKPAVNLALKHVNENPHVLQRYELDIRWKDSLCKAADGVWTFHSHLVEEPTKIMLLGPPCSPDTEPVAQTSERGNLVTLSYSAASPALSDKEKHPYFFRTYKTDVIFNVVKIWLFEKFNWTSVGSIHQNEDLFTLTHNYLYETLREEDNNINVTVKEIFDTSPTTGQIETMKDKDVKIILASAYEGAAFQLFCKAYQSGLYGRGYVWILPGWYKHEWWRQGHITDCTKEQVETAVEESLYISMEAANFSETPDSMTVAGYSANEIRRQLEDEHWDENATASGLEMFGYDALWAIALALNRTDEILAKDQYMLGRLENFGYDAKDVTARTLGSLLFREISLTSFQGASGLVDFQSGDQTGVVNIEQLQPYCDEGWLLFDISCYKFVNETRSWTDSRQYCKNLATERGSHLVSVLSEDESRFLEDTAEGSWYIGLTYHQPSKELYWVDTTKSRVVWFPTTFNREKETGSCYFWNSDTRTWKSSECKEERQFICKRRANFKEQVIVTLLANRTGVSNINQKGRFMWCGYLKDCEIPTDRTQPREEGLQHGAYVLLVVCASLGIVLAISLLIFNILARKNRIVKASSPNLNNLIVVGCVLIYLSICILKLAVVYPDKKREPADSFCMLRIWFLSVGFVLGFGAIFSKIWRVYRVANFKRSARKVVIKDAKLFGLVGILLLPDVVVLLIWTLVDPLLPMPHDIDIDRYVNLCNCESFNTWAIILGSYKGLILVIGVFLAWETRNVTIAALNDSKSIGLCIYTTTLLCIIGIATSIPFPNAPEYQYLITSGCMLFCTTFILLVVFAPKVWYVYKPPQVDRKSSKTSLHGSVSSRIPTVSEFTINTVFGTDDDNNNELSTSLSKLYNRRKNSYDVPQQMARVQQIANNRVRKISTLSSDDNVFL